MAKKDGQLSFELPELDRDRIKRDLESIFEKYRICKYLEFTRKEATTTQSYTPRENTGSTNVTSDQTANVAIYNVDEPKRRQEFCERIERAVRCLDARQRFLITEKYLSEDDVWDWMVYQQRFQPPISVKLYEKLRWKAFYRLALTLDIAYVKE